MTGAIAQLMTPTYSQTSYTDTDHSDDELVLGMGGLVERFICTGDTRGGEAGTRTGVTVYFNPITFREV
jgi:hypothetical protein